MIGVIAKEYQKPIVEEFFELFKVPWEHYNEGRSYGVIITTDDTGIVPLARLVIIFGSGEKNVDIDNNRWYRSQDPPVLLEHINYQFPVYKGLALVQSSDRAFITVKDRDEKAGIEHVDSERRILCIGYDLFEEIAFLLSHGQPVEYAHIPTIEIHIAMLRNWILDSGLPLVEIPPVPHGCSFIVCLTHDVDFMCIRDHKFDRSMIGFIIRAFFSPYLHDCRSKISWPRFLKNWKALLSLPGVYLGIFKDFWFDIDRYIEIEKGMCSTFFFIPFKNHHGDTNTNNCHPPKHRSAKYDINEHKAQIENLINRGHEIGLHGIDAWHNSQKGQREQNVIRDLTGEDQVGVRMHWLYFSDESPKSLEEAEFLYDSTLGYNNAVGFRSATTQVFCLPGSSKVFELSLNVMDTTMFYPKRMGLSESEALKICGRLIDDMGAYGGVFTINWHTRSLSPERNWDDFYIELLKLLKTENVWFATAGQAVRWFKERRSFRFESVRFFQDKIQLRVGTNNEKAIHPGDIKNTKNHLPPLLLRVHLPQVKLAAANNKKSFVDIPWTGETDIVYTFQYACTEANVSA
jgi:peptidoglycan/xylan/chitin deacetylase (PgdA/CDA1 family)